MVEILNQHAVVWALFFMGFAVFGSVFLCAEKGSSNRKWAGYLFLLNLIAITIFIYVFVLGMTVILVENIKVIAGIEIINQYAVAWAIFLLGFVVFGSVFLFARKGSEKRKCAELLFLLNLATMMNFIVFFVLPFPAVGWIISVLKDIISESK